MSHTSESLGKFVEESSVSLLPLSDSIRSFGSLPKTSGNASNLFSLRNRISSVRNASILSGRVDLKWIHRRRVSSLQFVNLFHESRESINVQTTVVEIQLLETFQSAPNTLIQQQFSPSAVRQAQVFSCVIFLGIQYFFWIGHFAGQLAVLVC